MYMLYIISRKAKGQKIYRMDHYSNVLLINAKYIDLDNVFKTNIKSKTSSLFLDCYDQNSDISSVYLDALFMFQ